MDRGKSLFVLANAVVLVGLAYLLLSQVDANAIMAALSAANFAATAEIAKLIGEENFTLLFHKGDKRNIHFSRLGNDYLIVTLFNDNVSLGLIRLKLGSAVQQMSTVFESAEEIN